MTVDFESILRRDRSVNPWMGRTHETLAVFPSPELAQAASARLHDLGIPEARMHLSASCTLSVSSSLQPSDRIRALLLEAGALDTVITEKSCGSSWFSHQWGHITGTGVEPGAGDSEAGVPHGGNIDDTW